MSHEIMDFIIFIRIEMQLNDLLQNECWIIALEKLAKGDKSIISSPHVSHPIAAEYSLKMSTISPLSDGKAYGVTN